MIENIKKYLTDFSDAFDNELTDRNRAGISKIHFELNLLQDLEPVEDLEDDFDAGKG